MTPFESALLDENRETNVPCSCAPPMHKERLPHSKWGIASLILPFFFFVTYPAYAIIRCIVHELGECPACLEDFCFLGLEIACHGIYGFILVWVVAFILAIIGLCRPRTHKSFPILGFCLSAPPVAYMMYHNLIIKILFSL